MNNVSVCITAPCKKKMVFLYKERVFSLLFQELFELTRSIFNWPSNKSERETILKFFLFVMLLGLSMVKSNFSRRGGEGG